MSALATGAILFFAIGLLSLVHDVVEALQKIALRLDELATIERARYSREQQMLDGVDEEAQR